MTSSSVENLPPMSQYFFIGSSDVDFIALEHKPEWTAATKSSIDEFVPYNLAQNQKDQKKLKCPDPAVEEYIIVRKLLNWDKTKQKLYPVQELMDPNKAEFQAHLPDSFITSILSSNDEPLVAVPRSWCLALHETHLLGKSDLMSLTQLSMPSLLHTLRMRYSAGEIYSGVGPRILIAVNPYRSIPALVSPESRLLYANVDRLSGLGEIPPHPFALAQQAFLRLGSGIGSQSIIISGESGAGKTETAKLILQYLAESDSTRRMVITSSDSANTHIESALLQTNPLLEAFGNAKTQRNDNSSRFGKFIRIFYDGKLLIHSTAIDTYLLEKCRLTATNPLEGNYHVFYQLIRGLDSIDDISRTQLNLDKFIENGIFNSFLLAAFNIDENIDKNAVPMQKRIEFENLINAMDALGMVDSDQIFKLLAACIHLGELKFVELNGECQIAEDASDSLTTFEKLIGHDGEFKTNLSSALCWKGIVDAERKELLMSPRPLSECYVVRDSLIRHLYNTVFSHIVRSVNKSLSIGSAKVYEDLTSIGLLDIYGFEVFGSENSFEQLCINYANERLQRHFNHHVFEQEQHIYEAEGIDWSQIDFNDNIEVITALDHKIHGVWSLLDSECQRPSGSDDNYNLMMQRHKSSVVGASSNPFLKTSHFCISHYAGSVDYDSRQFLLKNRDSLGVDTSDYLEECKLPIIQVECQYSREVEAATIRPSSNGNRPSNQRKLHRDSVSKVFRSQLDRLIELIDHTGPAYIRCIKPNNDKAPGLFDPASTLRQLEAGGMLESIRIRRDGYSSRLSFNDCWILLRPLLAETTPKSLEEALSRYKKNLWQVGHTTVFLKDGLHSKILAEVAELRTKAAIKIQSYVRMKLAVSYRKNMIEKSVIIQKYYRRYRAIKLLREHKAARLIQSCFKGYSARNAYRTLLGTRSAAAIKIQSNYRGYFVRRRFQRMSKMSDLARILCFVYRVYRTKRDRRERQLAQCLSAAWIRYSTRRLATEINLAKALYAAWMRLSLTNKVNSNADAIPASGTTTTPPTPHIGHSNSTYSTLDGLTETPELRTDTCQNVSDSDVLIGGPYVAPSMEDSYMSIDRSKPPALQHKNNKESIHELSRWKYGEASPRLVYSYGSTHIYAQGPSQLDGHVQAELHEMSSTIARLEKKVDDLTRQFSMLINAREYRHEVNESHSAAISPRGFEQGPPPHRPRASRTTSPTAANDWNMSVCPPPHRPRASRTTSPTAANDWNMCHSNSNEHLPNLGSTCTSSVRQPQPYNFWSTFGKTRQSLHQWMKMDVTQEKNYTKKMMNPDLHLKYKQAVSNDIDWAIEQDMKRTMAFTMEDRELRNSERSRWSQTFNS